MARIGCFDTRVPSWLFYYVIVLVTLAFCAAISFRAYTTWSKALSQYEYENQNLEVLRETNVQLKIETLQLSNDPRAIEAAARERLGMINPKGPKGMIGLQTNPEHESSTLDSEYPWDESLLIYLVLGLCYGGAILGGFIAVKSLRALGRLIVGRRPAGNGAEPSFPKSNYRIKPPLNTAGGLVCLLIFGVIIAAGFVFAGSKRVEAISLSQRIADLRNDRISLTEEQRRLLLSREAASSPARLEKAARALGMVNRMVAEDTSSVATIAGNAIGQPAAMNLRDFVPAVSIFLILAALGGTAAFMFSLGPSFSGLLEALESQSHTIGRAPGSRYLLLVDFLFSPKDVEHTFKPIIADWRTEYFDALNQKRSWKARWISIRYSYSFIASMGLNRLLSFIKTVSRVGGG